MSKSKLIPIKYDLTVLFTDSIDAHFHNLNNHYAHEMGFKESYLIPAKIIIQRPLPVTNKIVRYLIRYNYILAFNNDGILFMNIKYTPGSKYDLPHYNYTGQNGFISVNHINHIKLLPSHNNVKGKIITDTNTYQFSLKTNQTDALDLYLYNNKRKLHHKPAIASGNRFDLPNDPTYLNSSKSVKNLKHKLGTNFIGPVSVMCKHTPKFKSHIFDDCTDKPKTFLFSNDSKYVYLLKVNTFDKLPYFQNDLIRIPIKHLAKEIWYICSDKSAVYAITFKSLILSLSENHNLDINLKLYDFDTVSKAISHLSTVKIPAQAYKSYIKNQYKQLTSQEDKNELKHPKWRKFKSEVSKKNIIITAIVVIVMILITLLVVML